METSSSAVFNQLFPSLGPALMISMGYINLGKCFAAIEGGARFGHDLVLLVLIFNITAILCQYLAVCVGMVTGKDLAQICSEEYNRPACMMLGVQAEVSMFASDLTMIMGIAYGFTLLVGADLFVCTCFAIVGTIMLPFFISLMDNKMAETLYLAIAGCALLFYVLGVLISQPEMPLAMNIFFPKLGGDSAYLLMAFLGANVMAHNIYVHSSMVHHQKRLLNTSIGALFHDHFFAILFIFTGIFLVNYVLMNSAAVVFSNTDVALNFQDLSLLLEQILGNPVAPLAFLLVLLFSSQVTALTWSIGGKLILRHLFGATHSVLAHNLLVKTLSAISALCYAKCLDAEGIYQVLILCQVIQAMLLPSSVIPLFRVASSRLIMGTFKISRFLEMLALLAFLGMFGSNIIFVIEMLFGNSSWIQNLDGMLGASTMVSYAAVLVIACASMFFTIYLLVTPLKSASEKPDTELWNLPSQNDQLKISEPEEDNDIDKPDNEYDCMSSMETTCDSLSEVHHDKPIMEFKVKHLNSDFDSDQDFHQSNHDMEVTDTVATTVDYPDAPKSLSEVDLLTTEKVSFAKLSELAISEKRESEDNINQDMVLEPEACTDYEETVKLDETFKRALPISISEDSVSVKNVKEKSFDADNGSGSISKLFGLGRAARRQLAAILDEFWGHLFDFHGKLTQEASDKQLDVILGLNQRASGSVKLDDGIQFRKNAFANTTREKVLPNPTRQTISISDSSYGVQMGSQWSSGMPMNAHVGNSPNSLFASSETLNSNLNLSKHSDNHDYQPATIHGYQITSYMKAIGAGRSFYSSNILRDPPVSKPAAPFSPNFRDSVRDANGQNGFISLGISGLQNPVASQIKRLQAEGLNYDSSFIGPTDNVTSAYTKKYHSSPDISAIIAAGRQSFMNEAKCGGPIGPRFPSISMASKQSQYLNPISASGVPYEFSPTTFHRDVLSVQSNLNSDTGSLWSKQPFEQLFGVTNRVQAGQAQMGAENLKHVLQETSCGGSEYELLQSLYDCILKLLKLEGSGCLFKQNGGCDEDLIDRLAATEKCSLEANASEMNHLYSGDLQYLSSGGKLPSFHSSDASSLPYTVTFPNCGDNCAWQASLVVSFGVWCVRRILELSLVESRPELWGKYTYVLNHLQGILDLAFLKPRRPLTACSCLDVSRKDRKGFNLALQSPSLKQAKPIKGSFTTANTILETIKNVEIAISGRKGRTGTAAGDIAFPKGKENLASVLKRYKRRLSTKPTGAPKSVPSRKIPAPTVIV